MKKITSIDLFAGVGGMRISLSKALKKSDSIITMTLEEYEIYIEDYTKKSNYPDISK